VETRASAATAMAHLIEREWVVEVEASSVPGERELRYAYPYLWSTVYDGIDPDRRRAYHRVVAQYLELRPEGRAAMAQEDVARHLELAGDASGAAARYRRAADFARQSFFNERAIRLYSQALACLGEADLAQRIHLWHDLGSVYELKGDYEAALGGFERMLRLAWVCASRTKAAVAFNKMGRVWRRKGDLKLALEYLERGLELFEQADDHRGIAGSLDDIGSVLYLLGRYDQAYEKVTQGLARRGRGGDKRSIAHSLSNLGNIQKDRGRFPEALNCHREALEIRRAIGDRAGVIASLNNLGVLAFERGDYAEAREGWEQALTEAEDIGALPLQALALCNLGELALGEDRAEEARRRLEEAQGIAQEVDDRRLQVEATRNLALLEHAAGDGPRARQLALRAYQVAASAGLRDHEGRALLTLGQVFRGTALMDDEKTVEVERPGEPPMADTYFARGVELLRQIGNESELARGLERYGRYKIERGDTGDGVALLREALAIFSKLGMKERLEVEKVLAAV
ncbi:MAG TPA: tetratricopeptide repeat protein, partial [Kofleriaceae bacterium]|nr:tetratricopeptide repeat protein [Kofleriaceae bacterium]